MLELDRKQSGRLVSIGIQLRASATQSLACALSMHAHLLGKRERELRAECSLPVWSWLAFYLLLRSVLQVDSHALSSVVPLLARLRWWPNEFDATVHSMDSLAQTNDSATSSSSHSLAAEFGGQSSGRKSAEFREGKRQRCTRTNPVEPN